MSSGAARRRRHGHGTPLTGLLRVLMLLAAAAPYPAAGLSLYETLRTRPDLSTMLGLFNSYPSLQRLVNTETDRTTLFAPDNAAFASMPVGSREAVLRVGANAEAFVKGHIVSEKAIRKADFVRLGARQVLTYTTDLKSNIGVSLVGNNLLIGKDGGRATSSAVEELMAGSGVLQVLDAPLQVSGAGIPTETFASLSTFPSIFGALVARVGVPPGGVTCLAPTNTAFGAIGIDTADEILQWPVTTLSRIVNYAYLDSYETAEMLARGSIFVTTDVPYTVSASTASGRLVLGGKASISSTAYVVDGIMHVVDTVLQPPEVVFPTLPLLNLPEFPPIFKALVDYARLTETLVRSNLTILAPSDEAFQAAGIPDADAVSGYTLEDATWVVSNAVIRGVYNVERLGDVANAANPRVPTLNSALLTLARDPDNPTKVTITSETQVDNAPRLTTANIETTTLATDGILHVTDAVMLPDGVVVLTTPVPQTSEVTSLDLLIVAIIALVICLGGCFVLYRGSISQYMRDRAKEMEQQQVRLQQEAMMDDMAKEKTGNNYNNFEALSVANLQKQEATKTVLKRDTSDAGSGGGGSAGGGGVLGTPAVPAPQSFPQPAQYAGADDGNTSVGNFSAHQPPESPVGVPGAPMPAHLYQFPPPSSGAGTGVLNGGLAKTGDSPMVMSSHGYPNSPQSPALHNFALSTGSPSLPQVPAIGTGVRQGLRSSAKSSNNKAVYGMGYGRFTPGESPGPSGPTVGPSVMGRGMFTPPHRGHSRGVVRSPMHGPAGPVYEV